MVLDKTAIIELLCKDGESFSKKSHNHEDAIFIRTDAEVDTFDPNQIGNDSIDLRIADYAYVMRKNYNYINTLSKEPFDKFYKKITLNKDGYILEPKQIVFVPTLEKIALSGNLVGRILGRSVFARMGLSVHCTQDKFSSGINSVAGLQIINNSPIPLMIFPGQKLSQLMIEKTSEGMEAYQGTFCREVEYKLPLVTDKDRAQYDAVTRARIEMNKPKQKKHYKKDNANLILSIVKLIISILATLAMSVFGMARMFSGLYITAVCELIMLVSLACIEYTLASQEDKYVEVEDED